MAFTDDIPPLDDFQVHDFLFRKLPFQQRKSWWTMGCCFFPPYFFQTNPNNMIYIYAIYIYTLYIYIYVVGYITCGNPHKIYNQRWFASSSFKRCQMGRRRRFGYTVAPRRRRSCEVDSGASRASEVTRRRWCMASQEVGSSLVVGRMISRMADGGFK